MIWANARSTPGGEFSVSGRLTSSAVSVDSEVKEGHS